MVMLGVNKLAAVSVKDDVGHWQELLEEGATSLDVSDLRQCSINGQFVLYKREKIIDFRNYFNIEKIFMSAFLPYIFTVNV